MKTKILFFSIFLLLISSSMYSQSWAPVGPILNGAVEAIAVSGNDLYVGGLFTMAGSTPVNYIAKWDGSNWSALGGGLNGLVRDIAISGNNIYVGGLFTMADGVPVNYIAKWDGANWSALGSGMSGPVYTIEIFGNNIYAGGPFITSGGIPTNHIAMWDGANWNQLGSGMNLTFGIFDIAISGGFLYAGGNFTTAGGNPISHLAKWNGSTWSSVGTGVNNAVASLSVSGIDLYAAGVFTTAGGFPANYVAKWNGTTWSSLGNGVNDPVGSVALAGINLYVGGIFNYAGTDSAKHIAKWDGSNWSALGGGMNDAVACITLAGNDVYAGGTFTEAGGLLRFYIARYNDTNASSAGVNAPIVSGTGFVGFNNSTDTTSTRIMVSPGFGAGVVDVLKYSDPPLDPPSLRGGGFFVSDYRWVITQTGLATPFTGKIRFKISEIPNNGITQPDSVKVYSRPTVGSGTFTELPTVYWSGSGEIEADITSFSEFVFVSNVDPLPVELASFTSFVTKNDVTLHWATETETNNSGFEIQRRELSGTLGVMVNNEWENAGFVQGSGTSSELRSYNYTDRGLNTGKYNYRLKQIDYNGNFKYFELSNEVIIGVPGKFDLSQNYPNPFNPVTKINFEIPEYVNAELSNVKLYVYDIAGKMIAELVNEELSSGYHTVQFDAGGFPSGVYFYRLNVQNNSQNFSMTKKMVLLK